MTCIQLITQIIAAFHVISARHLHIDSVTIDLDIITDVNDTIGVLQGTKMIEQAH